MYDSEDGLNGQAPARQPMAESIIEISFKAITEALATDGGVGPPTLHMLCEDMDQPYAGYVSTRPFYRGADAVAAITRLGLLPSVLAATRVVIVWENADLLTGLTQPHQGYPHALMAVEATFTGHTLTRQPFTVTWGPADATTGLPISTPALGELEQLPDADLPQPIAAALDLWRQLRNEDLKAILDALLGEGFTVQFAAR
jgi:hypothetical protein